LETGLDSGTEDTLTLLDRVRVLRRRRTTIIAAVVIVPVLAVLYSLAQQPRYSASATVTVSMQNVASTILGTPSDNSEANQPERIIATQAAIARSPTVASMVVKGNPHLDLTNEQFLHDSSVSSDPTADLLTFSVVNGSPALARRLANAYSDAYVAERQHLDTAPYSAADKTLKARAHAFHCAPGSISATCVDLQRSITQLRTLQAVQQGNATVTTLAVTDTKVQPLTTRNAIFGVLAGLVVGVLLALVREALDTRVRSEEEIVQALGIPVLGRLRTPNRSIRQRSGLVLMEDPGSAQAEEFRSLRTNIDFANLAISARSIVVVSGREGEGKSTTMANLAVTFAEVGRSVALVDLDLRRPYVHRFFGFDVQPGFSDVLAGNTSLDDALQSVELAGSNEIESDPRYVGRLDVLAAGALPPDPAKLLTADSVGEILRILRDRYDMVLIDSPPVLAVSDAMIISANADAMIVVAHAELMHRDALGELGRVLSMTTTPGLGFVRTAAGAGANHGYGYGYGNYHPQRPVGTNGTWRARIGV
jgi:polysaccharide biosynthesis transport protein